MSSLFTFETQQSTQNRIAQLTEEQKIEFDKFVEQVRKEYVSDTLDMKALLRVFTITKGNVANAVITWKQFHDIWKEAEAGGSMEEVLDELATGKWALGGLDSEGRRIVHFIAKYHNPKQFSMFVSFKTQMIISELLLDNSGTQKGGAIFVIWLEGSGWNNFDGEAQRYFSSKAALMGQAGADMIHRCILVDAPWYVRLVMMIIRPFSPAELMAKNQMLTKDQLYQMYPEANSMEVQGLIEEVRSRKSFWF